MEDKIRASFYILLFLTAVSVFPQTDELLQRGSIPEELLRPRREESPRYPVDTVIGPIGQGAAPSGAYELARRIAAALLQGNTNAPVLSSVSRAFLEGCINALNAVNPRFYRLGSGREEPDGSVSFLVRFAGRDQGITGELFIRFEERVTNPPPPPPPPADVTVPEGEEPAATTDAADAAGAAPGAAKTPVVEKRWVFEDLILETPRTREEEIIENRQRYDFSPYERFF